MKMLTQFIRAQEAKKTWAEFSNRPGQNFWAVVSSDGFWIDSALSYEVALSLAAEFETCHLEDMDTQKAVDFFVSKTNKRYTGVSVIHSTMLKNLYETTDFVKKQGE
jgi:hypothetical protein